MSRDQFRILAISGSLRSQSTNTEALRAAAIVAPDDVAVSLYDGLGALPHFNPDLDVEGAVPPEPVRDLRAQIRGADALLICSPEYAHGVPGSLKNALDWLVSAPEMLFKPIALLNISPRSTHAYESLAETLRTMSTVVVEKASVAIQIPRGLDARAIVAQPDFAEPLHDSLVTLRAAATGAPCGC